MPGLSLLRPTGVTLTHMYEENVGPEIAQVNRELMG